MRPESVPEAPVPRPPAGPRVRCGVDVASIDRIEAALEEFGQSFRDRVFTPLEQAYCDGQGDPPQHYAARWAVKEAFLKAIDSEAGPVAMRDVGVVHEGERPSIALTERAADALEASMDGEGAARVEAAVSLSHDRGADRAIGQVVATAGGTG